MIRIKSLIYLITVFTVMLLALLFMTFWSPWINDDIAKVKAISHFQNSWKDSNDGCYIDCEDCGVINVEKSAFGKLVTLQFQCGWEGDVIMFKTNQFFTNFLGKTKMVTRESVIQVR